MYKNIADQSEEKKNIAQLIKYFDQRAKINVNCIQFK